jgi:hypothetical protein
MIFPTIHAENLEGRVLTLPTDLEGAYNVLFIAFQRDQHDPAATASEVRSHFAQGSDSGKRDPLRSSLHLRAFCTSA